MNSVRDGETRRLEAAALVRRVTMTRAVRDGTTAIRPAQTMMYLKSATFSSTTLIASPVVASTGTRELEARVMMLENSLAGRHLNRFGGEQRDLACGRAVQSKMICLLVIPSGLAVNRWIWLSACPAGSGLRAKSCFVFAK